MIFHGISRPQLHSFSLFSLALSLLSQSVNYLCRDIDFAIICIFETMELFRTFLIGMTIMSQLSLVLKLLETFYLGTSKMMNLSLPLDLPLPKNRLANGFWKVEVLSQIFSENSGMKLFLCPNSLHVVPAARLYKKHNYQKHRPISAKN